MTKRPVATSAAPKAIGPYSAGVMLEVPGVRTLYASGQTPLDPASGELVQGDVAVQAERVLLNLEAVLAAAGMKTGNVVKTTVFLTDMAEFARMNEVYGRHFAEPYPARTTVQVAALPRGARIEIELVAVAEG